MLRSTPPMKLPAGPASSENDEATGVAVSDIAIEGDYVSVANGESDLEVRDIENPANLKLVAQRDVGLLAVNLAIADDRACLLAREVLASGVLDLPFTLQQLNVSDLADPDLVDGLTDIPTIPGSLQSLVVGGDSVYLLDVSQVDVTGEAE